MSTFSGNDTLVIMGEEWNAQIREFISSGAVEQTPEVKRLAESLAANQSGEVEDRLTTAVYAGVLRDLLDRVEELEKLVGNLADKT
jgi:hypothetical protein